MAGPRRNKSQNPDLFSIALQREVRAYPEEAASPRLRLPDDLSASLKYLINDDLFRLKSAVEKEAAQRKLPIRSTGNEKWAEQLTGPPMAKTPRGMQITPTLPTPMAKVVRAALKAGVKPNVVSRQFGVSLASIKKALSEAEG